MTVASPADATARPAPIGADRGGRDAALLDFERADRACRSGAPPSPRSFLARSLLLGRRSFAAAGASDLDRALIGGMADPLVLRAALASTPDGRRRRDLAYALLDCDRASDDQVEAAATCLLAAGVRVVRHARRSGDRVFGWLASLGPDLPSARARSEDGDRIAVPLRAAQTVPAPLRARRFTFDFRLRTAGSIILEAAAGGAAARPLTLRVGAATGPRAVRGRDVPATGPADRVTVLLPVHGDLDSLSDCLDALRRQALPGLSFIVIDDASPYPEVEALARRFCRDVGGVHRRNAVNAGFAASINLGLSLCPSGDVLLLNSDVILPGGAIGRLCRAARSGDDIGIAAPFSNDAGNTTFPDPAAPGPPLSTALAAEVDAIAGRANAGRTVDLLSVMGSCLYLKRACLDRIGPLSLAYGRGYYEDIDLCLRARQHGFRVVAACNVYVSHASGRSFGGRRLGLIARNQAVIASRFPGYRDADACFDRAAPLGAARAAVEEALTPSRAPCVLLLGRASTAGALMERRAGMLEGDDIFVLALNWSLTGDAVAVALSSRAASEPRSLAFTLDADGRGRLARYLSRLTLVRMELFEPQILPHGLRDWIDGIEVPLTLIVDGHEAAAASRGIGSRPRGSGLAVLATDRMAAACLPGAAEVWRPAPPDGAARRDGDPSRLGILMGELCPAAERLVLALARRLRGPAGGRLIVLGRCIDDAQVMSPGTAWVTGPVAPDEMPEAVEHHGIGALLLPHRGSSFWRLDHLSRGVGRPSAYFDWSPRGVPARAGDLALDPALPDHEVCSAVARWCEALARRDGAPA